METEDFEEKFYSSETLSKLSKRIGGQPTHPMEAVFFAAMVYFDRIKTGFSNKNFDFKKSFCENVKKEMEIVINKELTGLENGLNFLASVGSTAPFIGLFGIYRMQIRESGDNPDSQFAPMPQTITPAGIELNPSTEPIDEPNNLNEFKKI